MIVSLLCAFLIVQWKTTSDGKFVQEWNFLFEPQCGVDLCSRQQAVPLSHRPSWIGQHICPVPELVSWGITAQEDLSHGIIFGHFIMIPHGNDQVYPLETTLDLRTHRGVQRWMFLSLYKISFVPGFVQMTRRRWMIRCNKGSLSSFL